MRRAASGGQSSYDAITIRRTVQFSLLEQAGLLLWHIGGRGPLFGLAFAIKTQLMGLCGMDWPDYLRDQAAMYRKLAEEALCVPKIRFGVDPASGRRKLAS